MLLVVNGEDHNPMVDHYSELKTAKWLLEAYHRGHMIFSLLERQLNG